MKNFKNIFKTFLVIFFALFLALCFSFAKKEETEYGEISSAYTYETSSIYIQELLDETSPIDGNYNLRDYYPMVCENQTTTPFCWLYTSLKSVESALMVQKNEYYNFSEIGMAYLYYQYRLENENGIINFENDGRFDTFVKCYQNCGFVLESDFSNSEYQNIIDAEYENFDYVNDFVITSLIDVVKPYQLYDNTYYNSLNWGNKLKVIKRFIKKYGALFAGIEGDSSHGCFYVDNNAENITDGVYTFYSYEIMPYINNSGYYFLGGNHAITVIGWNDNIHFGTETGAFLVMNSWGIESSSRSLFYVPYSYSYLLESACGFICDDAIEEDVSIESSEQSDFTTDILEGSKEINNIFCYDDDISITYKLNLSSFENTTVKVCSGNNDYTRLFNVFFDEQNKTVTVSVVKGTEFYGGYYTINFLDNDALIDKKSLFIFSGTELGYFKIETISSLQGYAFNNAYLNLNSTETICVSGPTNYYFLEFNLTNLNNYYNIMTSNSVESWKGFSMSVVDINVISSNNQILESYYTLNQLRTNLFYSAINESGNNFVLQIGVINGLRLSDFQNCMIRFKLKIDSVLYDDCSRTFTFNMFISDRNSAKTTEMNVISYELNGGNENVNNINRYPNYTLDDDMTTFDLLEPIKVGANFIGWYLTEDFSGPIVTKIDDSFSGNIKLFAKWNDVSIDYFDVDLSLIEIKDNNNQQRLLTDAIVYGDSIVLKFDFIKKSTLNGLSYSVLYFFYGVDSYSDYMEGDTINFYVNFPELESGNYTIKVKVVVKIGQSLMISKQDSVNITVLKKQVIFDFENLNQTYDGTEKKPTVVMVEDFYDVDKVEKTINDLVLLETENPAINVGSYYFYVSSLTNKNYSFNNIQSNCFLNIEKRTFTINWKEYNQVYDGQNHLPEYDIMGIVSGDQVYFDFTIKSCIDAKDYTINVNPATISNYNYKIGDVEDFSFTIQKANIEIILKDTEDRVQTEPKDRAVPEYTVVGKVYSNDDLQLIIKTEAKTVTSSGSYIITCEVQNTNYNYTYQRATYTLTGYYYVYYQLSNGKSIQKRVEEGQQPVGIDKTELTNSVFSKVKYSEDYQVTGNDIYVTVEVEDYSVKVYFGIVLGLMTIICIIYYIKKRESKVR